MGYPWTGKEIGKPTQTHVWRCLAARAGLRSRADMLDHECIIGSPCYSFPHLEIGNRRAAPSHLSPAEKSGSSYRYGLRTSTSGRRSWRSLLLWLSFSVETHHIHSAPKIVVLVIGNFQMFPDLLNCGCVNSTWNVMALKKNSRRLPE